MTHFCDTNNFKDEDSTVFKLFQEKARPSPMPVEAKKREMISCELCMAMFARENLLQNHLQKSHFLTVQNIRIYVCDKCDFRTGHYPTFQIHAKAKAACDPTKTYFKCEFCDQLLVTKFNRKAHCKIFHADKLEGNIKVFKCTLCKYKVGDENYFYEHKLKCKTSVKVNSKPLELKEERTKPNVITLRFGQFDPLDAVTDRKDA